MLEGVADKERRLSGRNGSEYGTTGGETEGKEEGGKRWGRGVGREKRESLQFMTEGPYLL